MASERPPGRPRKHEPKAIPMYRKMYSFCSGNAIRFPIHPLIIPPSLLVQWLHIQLTMAAIRQIKLDSDCMRSDPFMTAIKYVSRWQDLRA